MSYCEQQEDNFIATKAVNRRKFNNDLSLSTVVFLKKKSQQILKQLMPAFIFLQETKTKLKETP